MLSNNIVVMMMNTVVYQYLFGIYQAKYCRLLLVLEHWCLKQQLTSVWYFVYTVELYQVN